MLYDFIMALVAFSRNSLSSKRRCGGDDGNDVDAADDDDDDATEDKLPLRSRAGEVYIHEDLLRNAIRKERKRDDLYMCVCVRFR